MANSFLKPNKIISELIELFDQNDVIAYYDRDSEDDENDGPYEDDYFDDEY